MVFRSHRWLPGSSRSSDRTPFHLCVLSPHSTLDFNYRSEPCLDARSHRSSPMTHSVPLLDLWWVGPGLWFGRENCTTDFRIVGESAKIDRRALWNDLGRNRFCPDISNGYPQVDERVSGDLSAVGLLRNPEHNSKVWVELTTGRAGHSFAWQRRVRPKQVRSGAVNL